MNQGPVRQRGVPRGSVALAAIATLPGDTRQTRHRVVLTRSQERLADLPVGTGLAAKVGAIGAAGRPVKARIALMGALGAGGGSRAAGTWFDRL